MKKQELHPRTEVLNKKQKSLSKNARLEALRWLAKTFPNAFDNSSQIRPLKTGILADVLQYADKAAEEGISKSKLREAVVVFTRRVDYLTTLKAREMRVDLDGNPVSEVNEEEAEKAAEKIRRRIEKSAKNARKKASVRPTIATNGSKLMYPAIGDYESSKTTYYSSQGGDSDPVVSAYQPPKKVQSNSVIVKHKSSRQLDPNAVARLKEKLGLSRKKEVAE